VTAVAAVVLAYLVGAIPVGFLVARVAGTDIRRHGSGNIGTTNVLRSLGPVPAVLTLAGDVAKGYGAVALAAVVAGDPLATAAGAVAAVVGNCWPVFLRFRGGKGVATGLGALLRLAPAATWPAALVWIAVAATFRYASLASLAAAVCIPLGALLLGYPAAVTVATAGAGAVVALRHRENIERLLAGTERRLGEKASAA
jgi:glycerol-3-phosphate acyltransferase PlsY